MRLYKHLTFLNLDQTVRKALDQAKCHWQCCQPKFGSIAKSRWFGPISITASKNLSVTHHFIIILTTVHMQGCVEIMLDSLLMLWSWFFGYSRHSGWQVSGLKLSCGLSIYICFEMDHPAEFLLSSPISSQSSQRSPLHHHIVSSASP